MAIVRKREELEVASAVYVIDTVGQEFYRQPLQLPVVDRVNQRLVRRIADDVQMLASIEAGRL